MMKRMIMETIATVILMSLLTTKGYARPKYLARSTGSGYVENHVTDFTDEYAVLKQLLQHPSTLGQLYDSQNGMQHRQRSTANSDYPDFDKYIFPFEKQLLGLSEPMPSNEKVISENRSKSRSMLLRGVVSDLENMAKAAGEELTKTTRPLLTSSINVHPTTWTTTVAKRKYGYYNCDTTKLTIQTIIEYLNTGKICGRSINHVRFGFGG